MRSGGWARLGLTWAKSNTFRIITRVLELWPVNYRYSFLGINAVFLTKYAILVSYV